MPRRSEVHRGRTGLVLSLLLIGLIFSGVWPSARAAELPGGPGADPVTVQEAGAPDAFGSQTRTVGTLALVGFVLLTAYLLSRRAAAARADMSGLPSVRIVRRWPVARNAALLLIEVDGRFSLLGAGDQGIALIQNLPEATSAPAPARLAGEAAAGVPRPEERCGAAPPAVFPFRAAHAPEESVS